MLQPRESLPGVLELTCQAYSVDPQCLLPPDLGLAPALPAGK